MEYLIVLLPLFGSIISGFFGKKLGAKTCQVLTTLLVFISAILLIPKIKTRANTIETIILFILKKYINLVQLNSKLYHDL